MRDKIIMIILMVLLIIVLVNDMHHSKIDTSDLYDWCAGEYIDFHMTGATVIGHDNNSTYITDDRNVIHVVPYLNMEVNDFLLIWVDDRTGEVLKVWKEIYN